jgi:hypothetical protein
MWRERERERERKEERETLAFFLLTGLWYVEGERRG